VLGLVLGWARRRAGYCTAPSFSVVGFPLFRAKEGGCQSKTNGFLSPRDSACGGSAPLERHGGPKGRATTCALHRSWAWAGQQARHERGTPCGGARGLVTASRAGINATGGIASNGPGEAIFLGRMRRACFSEGISAWAPWWNYSHCAGCRDTCGNDDPPDTPIRAESIWRVWCPLGRSSSTNAAGKSTGASGSRSRKGRSRQSTHPSPRLKRGSQIGSFCQRPPRQAGLEPPDARWRGRTPCLRLGGAWPGETTPQQVARRSCICRRSHRLRFGTRSASPG
jgi:hypothetical protein